MKTGTFLVTHGDDDSALLRDVIDGQMHTLADSRDLEAGDVIEATIEPEPPLEVVWSITEIEARRRPTITESEEPPTQLARDLASDQEIGEVTRRERAGEGELHVLTVPPENTATAVADVAEDEATVERAARLAVERVEIRAADGVVSVRYLP
jgi:hypothetical protein